MWGLGKALTLYLEHESECRVLFTSSSGRFRRSLM